MYVKQTTVVNATGLHARPASEFVAEAKKYESKITIRNASKGDTPPVNAKSMLRLLSEGIVSGVVVEIVANGSDEVAAVDALVALIDSGFDE